jgi:N-formylglutamate amidohydrolase
VKIWDSVILHIPHSSLVLPKEAIGDIFIPWARLEREALETADLFADDLFDLPAQSVQAQYSRLVCDLERFEDDGREPMAAIGQGVFYTHLTDGTEFRGAAMREWALANVYRPHHAALTAAVDEALAQDGHCLIIDCHSFSLPGEQPDFCIGVDEYHEPAAVSGAKDVLAKHGCSWRLNDPYAGAIVPLKHFRKDKRVKSFMVEVNRRLYLNDDFHKSASYGQIKAIVQEMCRASARLWTESFQA